MRGIARAIPALARARHCHARSTERYREREQPVGCLLHEHPQRISRGLGFILEMSGEATEGLVPDEGFPKERVVDRLVQVPWR